MSNPWDNVPVYSGTTRSTEAVGPIDPQDQFLFRRLTSEDRPDTLDPMVFDRFNRLASWIFYANPLGRRLCQLPTDMCLGGGANIEIDKSKLNDTDVAQTKKFIDRFMNHPANQWVTRVEGYFTALNAIHGELFLPVFVNSSNGDVGIGYLEHNKVKEVKFNPNNSMEAIAVIQYSPGTTKKPLWWNVVRAEMGSDEAMYPAHPSFENPDSKINPNIAVSDDYTYAGEIFYFRTNNYGSGRGRSSLESVLDWLYQFDNFLYGDLRNANMQGAFVWDVELTGAELPELTAKAQEIRKNPPRHGEVIVHNEKERWEAKSPNINSASHSTLGNDVKRVIGLATGIPSHLIGAESEVNRTTAMSSDTPFIRRMERGQVLLVHLHCTILDYQLDQKKHAGMYNAQRPYPYRVVPPPLNAAEMLAMAEGLYNVTQSVLDFVARGGTSMAECRRIWYAYGLQEKDVPDDIQEQIAEEIKAKVIPDPATLVGTPLDPSLKAPGAPNSDANAGRQIRAKVPGRSSAGNG